MRPVHVELVFHRHSGQSGGLIDGPGIDQDTTVDIHRTIGVEGDGRKDITLAGNIDYGNGGRVVVKTPYDAPFSHIACLVRRSDPPVISASLRNLYIFRYIDRELVDYRIGEGIGLGDLIVI